MHRWGILIIFLFAQTFLIGSPVFANEDNLSLLSELNLQINEKGDASVFQQLSISGAEETLGKIVVTVPFNKIENINSAYDDGIELSSKIITENTGFTELELDFKRSPNSGSYNVILEYEVPKAMNSLKQIRVPNVSQALPVGKNSVRIMVPLTAGVVTSLGKKPKEESLSVGSQEFLFEFSNNDKGAVLSAASDITYSLRLEQTIKNDGLLPKRVSLSYPPDLHNQKVGYRDIKPSPSSTHLDREGNVVAEYLLWPKEEKSISLVVDVSVSKLQYDFSKVESLENLPKTIADTYLENNGVWKISDKLNTFVEEAVGSQSSPIKIVESLNKKIVEKLESAENGSRLSVEQILSRDNEFSHLNYSDLLVASLRSKGIPARLILGKKYNSGSLEEGLIDHSWVEAYLPGVGWMAVDPFFSEDTDVFGVSDVGKIGMSVAEQNGTLASNVSGTNSFSKLNIFVTDLKSELTTIKPTLNASATKYVVVPGVSITKAKLKVPEGVAIDNVGVSINGKHTYFGSLSPFENRTAYSWSFFGESFSTSEVEAGTGTVSEIDEVMAEDEAEINYILMIVVLGSAALLGAAIYFFKQFKKKKLIVNTEDDGQDVEASNMLGQGK